MTTAYTSLLGLALPVTGELSGTWGDTVNNSITSLVDSAVAGTTTLSSDADVSLTTTTGAANTSREAILLWTAGGTATRTITAPAQSKTYIVINKTSSTQSIKLIGAGPTAGVTIIAGESAVCAWNGLDFVKVSTTATASSFSAGTTGFTPSTATTGAITLAGTLAVANGGTGLTTGTSGGVLAYTAAGTLASSTALAASALVIGGGAGAAPSTTTTGTGVVTALGVNTGTAGAFVVNGGALGTPSSGTVTNLTGTASININGTVGATTPAAGTFTSLSDSGNLTFTGTGNRITGDFSSATSSVANRVIFQTSTANSATRITAIPNGTNQRAFLDLIGSSSDPANASALLLSIHPAGSIATIESSVYGTGTYLPLTMYTGGSERLRIDTSGLVGVGTASATSMLQTAGSSSVSAFKTPNIAEVDTISATAATGTINFDITTQSVLYYTSNASANWTVNFRGSSGTSLNTLMQTGESISATFLVTQGSTAYYNSAVTIDGNSVTPKWQGGTAPTSGNASSIDSYTYVLIKTGSAAFTVLASQTKFA